MTKEKHSTPLETELFDKKICGYDVAELLVFASACRQQGVTEEDIHNFVQTADGAIRYAVQIMREDFERFMLSGEDGGREC